MDHAVLEALEDLAVLLEASNRQKRLRRTLTVAAFAGLDKAGKPKRPVDIEKGDELYLQRTQQAAAGTLSPNPAGRLFATALETLGAGHIAEIEVGLYEKLWVTDGDPCEICDENAIAGWIPADEEFPSGDDEPDAHPNCKCSLETRRAE